MVNIYLFFINSSHTAIDFAINNCFVIFQLQDLFPIYKDCIYRVRDPTSAEVIAFLKPLIMEAPLQPPVIETNEQPPPLPLGKKWSFYGIVFL